MLKKLRSIFVRVGISLLSLGVFLFAIRNELREGLSHLTHLEWMPLVIAFVIMFISLVVVTFRLGKILSIQGVHPRFLRLYYLWMISLFFNLFLPSAVGGDIAKAYYIYKDSGKKMATVTSVLLDRFFGLMATISIGFLAFLLGREHIDDPRIGQLLFWVAAFVFIGVLFVMSRRFSHPAKSFLLYLTPARFRNRFEKLFEALDLYRNRRLDFGLAYLESLVAGGLFIVLVFFLARSIQIDIPLTVFFLFIPLVNVFSMIPSMGGLGVRETAMVYFFKNYMALDQAVALSLILDLFLYGIGCACGILYGIRGGHPIKELRRMEVNQMEEA